jgi:transposase
LYREFANRERVNSNRIIGSGRPNTAVNDDNEELLHDLMSESRSWTLEQLAYEIGISYSSTQRLVEQARYTKKGPVWEPHKLTEHDKT